MLSEVEARAAGAALEAHPSTSLWTNEESGEIIFDEPVEAEGEDYFRLGALDVSPNRKLAAVYVDTADAPTDFATYQAEVALAREIVKGRSLDEKFRHPRQGHQMDLRWLFLHMIEEYARHCGHADLIRERIDGVTGE